MDWFAVKMIFQIVGDEGNSRPQFDEQLRLIRADSAEWALQKASTLGRMEQSTFLNAHRKEVNWKFIGVVDVSAIEVIEDGAALHTCTKEYTADQQYMDEINARVKMLPALLARSQTKRGQVSFDPFMFKLNYQ